MRRKLRIGITNDDSMVGVVVRIAEGSVSDLGLRVLLVELASPSGVVRLVHTEPELSRRKVLSSTPTRFYVSST